MIAHQTLLSVTVEGVVERITFHNHVNGFCVLKARIPKYKDLITVTGKAITINVGESARFEGSWSQNSKYGLQFQSENITIITPSTLASIEKYLGSGSIKGIGPYFAKKIVALFGEKTFEVFDKNFDQLRQIKGLGKMRREQILLSWKTQKVTHDIMLFLQNYQISSARATRIYKTYGDQSIQKIQENPYRLSDEIYGIGFMVSDTLAKRMGIKENSLIRAIAGLQHVIKSHCQEGHCAIAYSLLQEKAVQLLAIEPSIIEHAIEHLIQEGQFVLNTTERIISPKMLYHTEKGIALELQRLLKSNHSPWQAINKEQISTLFKTQQSFSLSDAQRSVILKMLQAKIFILTGGPGVGKTTIVKNLLSYLNKKKHLKISLCAPTGRAAQRLSITTGQEAYTVHRLLKFDPKTFGFVHHQSNPLETDYLIVDEVSMLDVNLTYHLLKALPSKAHLLLIGDSDQLPSVGAGRVLADLIESNCIACEKLVQIFRQASTSQIVVNAHRINQGEMPLFNEQSTLSDFYFIESNTSEEIQNKIIKLVLERIPKRFQIHPVRDIQILVPMNRGNLGIHVMNQILQKTLNVNTEQFVEFFNTRFMLGDKVIQQINNYDKEIFNGDIGYIESIRKDLKTLHVKFDHKTVAYTFEELDELQLAYAMSIHKSQGSEYPAIVIPIATQHYRMLARNLLYTGITRGKKLVVLIGQKKALRIGIYTVQQNQRLTQLKKHLQALMPSM